MKVIRPMLCALLLSAAAAPLMAQKAAQAPVQTGASSDLQPSKSPAVVVPERLLEWLESDNPPLLLDVRTPKEYRDGHIAGAINIPHTFIGTRSAALAQHKDRDVVIYCETGLRAQFAQWVLTQQGFSQTSTLDGHMRAWRQQHLPLAQ